MARNKSEVIDEYIKENYDLVPFKVRKDAQINGKSITEHATAMGESRNGFLKRAVEETIALDNESSDLPAQIQCEIEGVELPQKTSHIEKVAEYNKKTYDALAFRVRKDSDINDEIIKSHASAMGESLNAFINRAIEEVMALDDENFVTVQETFSNQTKPSYGRIQFFVRKDAQINDEVIKNHAAAVGESLNGFLKRAVALTIARDNTKKRPLPIKKEESLPKTHAQVVKDFNKKVYNHIIFKVRKDADINGDVIRDHALLRGETLGGFIKRAVEETFKRDLKQRRQDF